MVSTFTSNSIFICTKQRKVPATNFFSANFYTLFLGHLIPFNSYIKLSSINNFISFFIDDTY